MIYVKLWVNVYVCYDAQRVSEPLNILTLTSSIVAILYSDTLGKYIKGC
jgi:hypothetical protein